MELPMARQSPAPLFPCFPCFPQINPKRRSRFLNPIFLVLQISICSEKKIRIYRFADRSEQTIDEVESITSLCISGDSRYLLVNLSSQVIHLWDLGGSRLPQKPAIKYKGQKQGRYVIRSCFGGSAQKFIVSGSEDSQVSPERHPW
jgi:WD40 repeat protein